MIASAARWVGAGRPPGLPGPRRLRRPRRERRGDALRAARLPPLRRRARGAAAGARRDGCGLRPARGRHRGATTSSSSATSSGSPSYRLNGERAVRVRGGRGRAATPPGSIVKHSMGYGDVATPSSGGAASGDGGVGLGSRSALTRRGRASVALPAGAHPGPQDGQGDDLLAGALRVHARQLDPDPARPLRLRQVRQARRGLQRRLAGLADPQDPAHQRPAQHRAVRRRPPRQGDRLLGHLRRPRLPRRGDLRRRSDQDRREGRAGRRSAIPTICARSSRRRT